MAKIKPDNFIKVQFELDQEGGYPPVKYEGLWCINRRTHCVVNNSPVFAEGISVGDEIVTKIRDGVILFDRVTKKSGNSNVVVFLDDVSNGGKLRAGLDKFGCRSESAHVPSGPALVAVLVPADAPYNELIQFLQGGKKRGLWTFHETARRHPAAK